MNRSSRWNTARTLNRRLRWAGRLGLASLLAWTGLSSADDTEIFRASYDGSSARPQVLIIFDNSFSMNESVNGESKLSIAKRTVYNIVDSNPGIDFGLMVFNRNEALSSKDKPDNGGRVVVAVTPKNADKGKISLQHRTKLLSTIQNLQTSSYTPLCETAYEAYRYLTGDEVIYGMQRSEADMPARDVDDAEHPGQNYRSPVGACQNVHVVLMTDGEPQFDEDANDEIEQLTGKTCRAWKNYSDDPTKIVKKKNCLPELAQHMYENDLDGDEQNGKQRAITYTIGFTTDQPLLDATAKSGGGQYFRADNADELKAAFEGAITAILNYKTSFSSPAIAANQYLRTESRNEAYFGMFQPTLGSNWPGNIKKLRLASSNGKMVTVDTQNKPAIDSTSGHIAESAVTFWSNGADGPEVKKGGVGARMLDLLVPATRSDNRKVLSNIGANGALDDFTADKLRPNQFGLINDNKMYELFGAKNRDDFEDLIAWSRGWTDRNKNARRDWIMGDVLHSRPLVLDYGARPGFTLQNPDLRLVVGTNAGFLHLFANSDGRENWAIFPKELAPLLNYRRQDRATATLSYGIDAPPVVYRRDVNGDGTISAAAGDRMWLFFGLGRGGRQLYALDVTDPDNPVFMWRLDNSSASMSELGQTWSVPVVTTVPGHSSANGKARPVLVLGAGYDPAYDAKDSSAAQLSPGQGRGVFIVDAETGALVWRVTRAQDSRLAHAIVAPVKAIDGDGDGRSERLYVPDLGGNVWRIDLSGKDPSGQVAVSGRLSLLAQLAGAGHAGDRRFFNAVDMVRTQQSGLGFDAVLLGSGDRSNPLARDNSDRFYLLRDLQTAPITTDAPTPQQCDPDTGTRKGEARCRWPLTHASLDDATTSKVSGLISSSSKLGWYLDLNASTGEKSLSSAITLYGTVYFSTFSPESGLQAVNLCEPAPGEGRLYALKLADASPGLVNDERSTLLGSVIPGTPAPYFAPDRTISLLFPAGAGVRDRKLTGDASVLGIPGALRPVMPTHWSVREF
jgi:type IV pilus assembly protein PilY1